MAMGERGDWEAATGPSGAGRPQARRGGRGLDPSNPARVRPGSVEKRRASRALPPKIGPA